MIFYNSQSTDPYWNLALEEYAFERLDSSQPVFLLWQNDNTIVVGVHQNTAQEINAAYVKEHGVRVVRRLTGGGAVYHDLGNLNYTIIADKDEHEAFCFNVFVSPLIRALRTFGVNASFSGRNDLLIDGKKISGSAQMVRRGRILHHGCIMLDSDLEAVSEALCVREAKYDSRGIPSVRSRVTTVNREAPSPISINDFRAELTAAVREGEPTFEEYTPTLEALAEIEKLRNDKYATWEWNYGESPDYNVEKERRFAGGLVTAQMFVSGGRIQTVRFFGDFFGEGDLRELEASLEGLPVGGEIGERLSEIGVEQYFHGISAKEIASLLTD